MSELKEMLQDVYVKWARSTFRDTGFFMPTWFLHSAKKGVQMFVTDWGNQKEKEASIEVIRSYCRVYQVTQAFLVQEAWTKAFKKGEKIVARLANEPDKQEVVIIQGEDIQQMIMAQLPIIRTGNKPTLGKKIFWIEGGYTETIFSVIDHSSYQLH